MFLLIWDDPLFPPARYFYVGSGKFRFFVDQRCLADRPESSVEIEN